MLNQLATDIHATAVEKGFWEDNIDIHFILSKLALVHSEVSEVLEATRKEKGPRAIAEELADIIIRVLDLYKGLESRGWVDEDIDEVLESKMRYNTTRPRKHGVLA